MSALTILPERPYPNAYPVLPGRLFAGEYPLTLPGSGQWEYDRALSNRQRLENLVSLGITHYIDLTEEGEWPQYWAQLQRVAADHNMNPIHHRFPIVDHTVPPIDLINLAVNKIHLALGSGDNVMVHCKAGVGRTALIVAAYLVQHHELTGQQALERIAELRIPIPDPRPAPLKTDQRNLIQSW